MSERQISSPCVSICFLDEEDICQGCYRSAIEITDWSMLNDDGKREVLARCAQRARDAGAVIDL
ncbi:DUF1289 domain-containing protein [Halieaceae bacterium IMCC14734]|uniref:DUF1289 domain-containing protein n=1 Tax=Candidatus Litorirhabdus singularis TaxID=2518993 RepID=A0ABT3TIG5_9GAMM|nr:DUF1289 domain-containing protein [Candidatus Litorirhabdus singularis]MCX2981799.1 DUF1289 domain-containing protein [Candidatus Litorirhabdus singularis]